MWQEPEQTQDEYGTLEYAHVVHNGKWFLVEEDLGETLILESENWGKRTVKTTQVKVWIPE